MSGGLRLRMREHLDDPSRKRLFNEQLFEVVAPRYDRITRLLSFGRDQAWKRLIEAWLPQIEAPACLDLACGTGDLCEVLVRRYPDGDVIGIDLTEQMLEIARKRKPLSGVRFEQGDMSRLDVPAGSIDVVTGGYALRNAPSLEHVLGEVRRVLKPGGVALFLDFSRPANAFLSHIEYGLLVFWGGLWGWVFHRNPDVYTYIAASLTRFPHRKALHAICEANGLPVTCSTRLFFGVMELIRLQRAAS